MPMGVAIQVHTVDMISLPPRVVLPALAVTAVLVGGTVWFWPDSGSPVTDAATSMCRQKVADRLGDPSPTFGDVTAHRDGDTVEVAGKVISYTPLATYAWTCHATGRNAGDVRVEDVQLTNR